MSGTGKSAALQLLGARGHHVVDTDTDRWSHWVTLPDGSPDWIWREDAIARLLASHHHGHLFAEVEEIRLGPLARAEVEQQVAALAGARWRRHHLAGDARGRTRRRQLTWARSWSATA